MEENVKMNDPEQGVKKAAPGLEAENVWSTPEQGVKKAAPELEAENVWSTAEAAPEEEAAEKTPEEEAAEKMPEEAAEEKPAEETETQSGKKKEKEKKSVGAEILSWVLTLLAAVAAALVIRSFLFEPIRVDGASMNDTLANGEVMFVSKLDYASTWLSLPWQSDETKESAPRLTTGFGSPQQFDVVIVRYPGRGDTNFVKRLIGMPGDRVRIEDGYLYVNDVKYDEPYINDGYRNNSGSAGGSFEEVYIPKKGDVLSLEYTDENRNRIGVYVNGEAWTWRGISSDAVAADGDRLSFHRDGTLKLNGQDISADTQKIISLVGKEFSLEKDLYFVMGDHRNNSNDSRATGPISRDMIVGHVRFVFFPFSSWRGIQ